MAGLMVLSCVLFVRKERCWRHDCKLYDGCCSCNLLFYTSKKVSTKRTDRTLMLCEFCYKGEWTRFGCRIFEVVKLSQFFLVLGCVETVIWSFEKCGGLRMLSDALGQGLMLSEALGRGVQTIQCRIHWASSGNEALESLESVPRACILEEAFGPAG
jgi:hypothetical protein